MILVYLLYRTSTSDRAVIVPTSPVDRIAIPSHSLPQPTDRTDSPEVGQDRLQAPEARHRQLCQVARASVHPVLELDLGGSETCTATVALANTRDG